jgi:hypothetical protein
MGSDVAINAFFMPLLEAIPRANVLFPLLAPPVMNVIFHCIKKKKSPEQKP